jgi:hypothetical protein
MHCCLLLIWTKEAGPQAQRYYSAEAACLVRGRVWTLLYNADMSGCTALMQRRVGPVVIVGRVVAMVSGECPGWEAVHGAKENCN